MLYIKVIKKNISGSMPAPTTVRGKFDVKNGFYHISDGRTEQLKIAIAALAKAVGFNERTGTTNMRAENIGAVTTALYQIELANVDDLARVATQAERSSL
jgi:hypothetical protein